MFGHEHHIHVPLNGPSHQIGLDDTTPGPYTWDSIFGFYTGDDGGVSHELEMEIVDMNYQRGSHQVGNTMNGVARITHWWGWCWLTAMAFNA